MKKILLLPLIFCFFLVGFGIKNDPPRKAKITFVKVNSWSEKNIDGNAWDANSAPDLYLQLKGADLKQVPNDPTDDVVFPNQSSSIRRNYETPYLVENPSAKYYLQLMDKDDLDSDDDMGMVGFKLSDYPDQPAVVFLTQNNLSVEVGLVWQ